jgi:DNA-binding NarL/FixJ family response regulator
MGQVFRRVVVAEGDALDRAGVCAIVRQHVGVSETFCVSNFSELTAALESAVDWSCVALDLSLPGLNGVHGITLLRQQHPSARLIVMSRQTDRATALAAIAAGAHGFVPKDMAVESMAGAFTLVIDGHVFLPDRTCSTWKHCSLRGNKMSFNCLPRGARTRKSHAILAFPKAQ